MSRMYPQPPPPPPAPPARPPAVTPPQHDTVQGWSPHAAPVLSPGDANEVTRAIHLVDPEITKRARTNLTRSPESLTIVGLTLLLAFLVGGIDPLLGVGYFFFTLVGASVVIRDDAHALVHPVALLFASAPFAIAGPQPSVLLVLGALAFTMLATATYDRRRGGIVDLKVRVGEAAWFIWGS